MAEKTIKDSILKKGLKSIPNFVWVFCASYALIMVTNLFVLNFAHIDADKHINRYLDIILTEKELNHANECKTGLDERLKEVEKLAHKSTVEK